MTPNRRRALLLLAAILAAAAIADLGTMHRLEHGDSIVPVLVSLQRWTPFYWDQDRYGMLVPLLARPLRDPLWNLLAQRFLLVAAGLAAIPLLARHVLAGRDWPLAGALATALLLAAPEAWRFEYLGDQPYGLSLSLALAGLAFAEPLHAAVAASREGGPLARALRAAMAHPRRLAAGFALVVLAHWVNAATGIVLLALAAARAAVDAWESPDADGIRARLLVDAGLLAAGLAAGQAIVWAVALGRGRLGVAEAAPLSPASWPHAWSAFLENAWREAGIWRAVLGVSAGAGVATLAAVPRLRPALPGAVLRALALCAAALAYALFAGSLRWVEANAFHWRYLAPAAVLVHLAATSLLAEPLSRLGARGAGRLAAAASALVPAAAVAAYGAPSLGRVRADLDAVAGAHTADVVAGRCDLVAGDYWSVWPAVWDAARVRAERGQGRPVWGISHRSNPTLPQWQALRGPALRVCVPRGDGKEAERWLRAYHLWPVRIVARLPTLTVEAPLRAWGDLPTSPAAAPATPPSRGGRTGRSG